jgi:glycosyltransferase involved in cell wall biosynthesis
MTEPRVLQLVPPNLPPQAQALQRRLGQNVRALVIPPRTTAAVGSVRRERGNYDLVHAYGLRSLTAAALGASGRIIFTPDDEVRRSGLRWLRAVLHYRDVRVVFPSDTMQRWYVERGVSVARSQLIRPGVDFARINKRRDTALRQRLGFCESDRVMLLVGRSTRTSGHEAALWAAAILGVLDPKFRVLAWGNGPRTSSLVHFARSQKQPKLFTIAPPEMSFESLFSVADLMLATPTQPLWIWPLAAAMASGLPIVGVASRAASELLEDRHTALLARTGKPKDLARRILDLEEDPALATRLGEQARTEAYEYFSMTRFVQEHKALYEHAAAAAVR